MTEWRTLIVYSVELIMCGLVLFYTAFLNGIGRTANEIQMKEADAVALLAEYREFNKYDNTILWSQDVISTILQYRGLPEVHVKYKTSGTYFKYQLGTVDSDGKSIYTNAKLTPKFNVSSKFKSTIHKDENGSVDAIIMEEQ